MILKEIAIYGAGGFAREVAWLADSCSNDAEVLKTICFIDDNPLAHGKTLNGIPVLSLLDAHVQFSNAFIVGGVGSPQVREELIGKASNIGFHFTTLIHPRVERSSWVEIGTGTVICAGNILTTNIVLEKHVQINLDCSIGHDVIIGEYTTLAPGVHVSGWVRFGKRVYVGTGATIINGTQEAPILIGDDAVIGAGACVVKSVPPGITVVGVPARPLQK